MNDSRATADDLDVMFLAQGEQSGEAVAERLAAFIDGARRSLDIAVYDFNLSPALAQIVGGALARRAAASVEIRIAFDGDAPGVPDAATRDPTPSATETFVALLGYPWRRIHGLKLMHQKYIVRDGGTPEGQVWTGSTNLTDDAWTLQENNILEIRSAQIAAYYTHDFTQLWDKGAIGHSGNFPTAPVRLLFDGEPAEVEVCFSPGHGEEIDAAVARHVRAATSRIRVCSMLLNSSALLVALGNVVRDGRVPVSGVYDRTQMEDVLRQWREVPGNRWKIGAVEAIVEQAGLIGKNSTPYTPTSRHDFMHNKVFVVDDTVITGSYNFSHSAEMNAENILLIECPALADRYSQYIDHLMLKYGR